MTGQEAEYTTQTADAAVSGALYRFFAAFTGFDAAHSLGYEAEVPEVRGEMGGFGCGADSTAAEMAAVFTMEPTLTRVRRYINGGGTLRGACTVTGRVRDDDAQKRRETAAFFGALAAYIQKAGARYVDGERVYVIRPAAHPARLRLTGDGAVWELRCSVEFNDN